MFDRLWEEDPKIQKMQKDWETRGHRQAILAVIEVRFPSIVQVAQQRIARIEEPEDLNRLLKLIAAAPDELAALGVLNKHAA